MKILLDVESIFELDELDTELTGTDELELDNEDTLDSTDLALELDTTVDKATELTELTILLTENEDLEASLFLVKLWLSK